MNINLGYLIQYPMFFPLEILKKVCERNLKRIILSHLNINSIRNKFDLRIDQIKDSVVMSFLKRN